MYYAAFSSKPGGAVTGIVLLLAGRCPEPTQRRRRGGQVATLTPDGDLRYGETDALLYRRGLGGERQARDDGESTPPSLPFPATDVLQVKTRLFLLPGGRMPMELRTLTPHFLPLGTVEKWMTIYSDKQMTFIFNLKEGDVSLA